MGAEKAKEMLEMLDVSCRYMYTAFNITKTYDIASVLYKSMNSDITKHIKKVACIDKELFNMDAKLEKSRTIGILVGLRSDPLRLQKVISLSKN